MNFKRLYSLSPMLFFSFISSVYAVPSGLDWASKVKPGGPSDLTVWVPDVLEYAIGLAALVCIAILIGSGYMYITAAGDEEKVRKAGKSITYAVVGLVICVVSVILVEFVLKKILVQQPS